MPRVTELYAYVIADADEDDEGVPGFSQGAWLLPMMGADRERADSFRDYAQQIATAQKKPVRLIRSTGLEVVETFEP